MSDVFYIKRGDTLPAFRATLYDGDSPANLAGATVSLVLRAECGSDVLKKEAVVVDASGGVVQYDWEDGDTDVAGKYRAEFEVTTAAGKRWTFPTQSAVPVVILGDLG